MVIWKEIHVTGTDACNVTGWEVEVVNKNFRK